MTGWRAFLTAPRGPLEFVPSYRKRNRQSRQYAVGMIPDGLEPSFSGCGPEVVAAGPRDRCGSYEQGSSIFATKRCFTQEISRHALASGSLSGSHPQRQSEPDASAYRLIGTLHSTIHEHSPPCKSVAHHDAYLVRGHGFLPPESTPQSKREGWDSNPRSGA